MLARIPGLRVAVCNSRAEAISRWRGDSKLILLDDAFQNPSVYRDHELVLIDATVPPEEIHVIPCGRFREGLDALIRADTVLFTRTDLVARDRLDRWMEAVRGVNRDVELFFSEHRIEGIQPALEQGASVVAFCGIGNPDSFFDLLEREGYSIGQRIAFADHHAFTKREIARLGSVAPPLITTEKDFVRLAASAPEFAKRVHVLKIGFGIVGGREAEFFARIGGDA
jgi:tetraacyldisaccharide 4'-kinase